MNLLWFNGFKDESGLGLFTLRTSDGSCLYCIAKEHGYTDGSIDIDVSECIPCMIRAIEDMYAEAHIRSVSCEPD